MARKCQTPHDSAPLALMLQQVRSRSVGERNRICFDSPQHSKRNVLSAPAICRSVVCGRFTGSRQHRTVDSDVCTAAHARVGIRRAQSSKIKSRSGGVNCLANKQTAMSACRAE
jgi:hypothetical protein